MSLSYFIGELKIQVDAKITWGFEGFNGLEENDIWSYSGIRSTS